MWTKLCFLSCELRSFCALHLVCFPFYIMPLMRTPMLKITGRNKLWPVPTVLFLCVWLYKYGLVSRWCCLHPNGECWNELPAHDAWAGGGVIFWMDDSQRVLLGQSRQVGSCMGYTDFFFSSEVGLRKGFSPVLMSIVEVIFRVVPNHKLEEEHEISGRNYWNANQRMGMTLNWRSPFSCGE